VEIYIQALHMLNLPMAGLLSAVQLLFTLLLAVVYTRLSGQRGIPLAPRVRGEALRRAEKWPERLMVWGVVVVLVVLLVSPLAALSLRSVTRLETERGAGAALSPSFTLAYYQELFINRRQALFYVPPIAAARNSLFSEASRL
jgi:thiamine transport system permease protein